MNRTRSLVAVTLAFSVLVTIAQAHHIAVEDGKSERGILDIKRVLNRGGWDARWRITTYKEWNRKAIWDQGFLSVYLDTFGSGRHDYYALIYADAERVRGALFRDREFKSDYKVRGLRVTHPRGDSVLVTVPLKKLRIAKDRATYNWYAQTTWTGRRCRRVCFDWAPDSGRDGAGIEEPLPLTV